MQDLAPIVLFVYNRPAHTQRVIEALQKNELSSKSKLYVFSDGPRNEKHTESVLNVRKLIKGVKGFLNVEIIEREKNLGLATSIISGVSEILNHSDRIIVLEDDLLVSPYFIDYVNQGLFVYENDLNVASIHGYIYPIKNELPQTFFLRGADCWGWATWKRAWATFEQDAEKLINKLSEMNLVSQFDFNGSVSNFNMLQKQSKGLIASWAIRWHASCFIRNMYTLYPGTSLVRNIGNDDSGTHTLSTRVYDTELFVSEIPIDKKEVFEEQAIRSLLENYFYSIKPSLTERLISFIRRSSK